MAKKVSLKKALGAVRGCVRDKSVKGKAGVASCAGKKLRKIAVKRRKPRTTSAMRKARSKFKSCSRHCKGFVKAAKGKRKGFFRACMRRCVRGKR